MRTILIFGDSIAMGFNASDQEGWAHHFKKFLEERESEARVVNLARDGSTTKDILSHIEKDLQTYSPEEVIIEVGLNDSAYSFDAHRPNIPREQFDKNIAEILEITKKYAKKVVVLGILRADERRSTFSDDKNIVYQYQNITIQKYNDSLRALSQASGATFVDPYLLLSDEELDDGYHPTTEGHLKIFEEVKKAF